MGGTLLMNSLSPVDAKQRGRKHKSLDADENFAEGVFFKVSSYDDLTKSESSSRTSSTCSLNTLSVVSSPPASWKSTETNSFYLHQPLMVSDPECELPVVDEAEALGRAMLRSKELPSCWYFSSNHIMVNQERTKRVTAPLTRLKELDSIAREHADAMAASHKLFHSDPAALPQKFNRPSRRMGENVAVGATIKDIHKKMMATPSDKHNILHRRYTHMGMATAKGSDGQLYLCQVFRG